MAPPQQYEQQCHLYCLFLMSSYRQATGIGLMSLYPVLRGVRGRNRQNKLTGWQQSISSNQGHTSQNTDPFCRWIPEDSSNTAEKSLSDTSPQYFLHIRPVAREQGG